MNIQRKLKKIQKDLKEVAFEIAMDDYDEMYDYEPVDRVDDFVLIKPISDRRMQSKYGLPNKPFPARLETVPEPDDDGFWYAEFTAQKTNGGFIRLLGSYYEDKQWEVSDILRPDIEPPQRWKIPRKFQKYMRS